MTRPTLAVNEAGKATATGCAADECSISDNVALQYPDLEFVRPCNLCPPMKRITLPKIRPALETMTHEVTVDPEVAERARLAVERMMALG
jgi:quinolinate synthase